MGTVCFALLFSPLMVMYALLHLSTQPVAKDTSVCVFGHKINHRSIKFFPCFFFLHLCYNLASDKLKPLTLIVNITSASKQFIQVHPNESN